MVREIEEAEHYKFTAFFAALSWRKFTYTMKCAEWTPTTREEDRTKTKKMEETFGIFGFKRKKALVKKVSSVLSVSNVRKIRYGRFWTQKRLGMFGFRGFGIFGI